MQSLQTDNSDTAQSIGRADVRQMGINPNHWYAVARSTEVTDKPWGVALWDEPIVVFRDRTQTLHALADRCPHRFVKLSRGQVVNDTLECAYHGWRIDAAGNTVEIPYLEENQKLPNCQVRQFPVKEQDGFVWVFPGDSALAATKEPLPIPEWNHLNYIATVSVIDCEAHFSYLIENLMDMYHGHLHQNYQAWADPKLERLEENGDRVDAYYQAQSYYRIDKIWSISQLFFPSLRRLHPELLTVSYPYPNWSSTLGEDFKIYCLFSPTGLTHTRAYLIHFTSLNAFHRLHKLPDRFRRFVKNSLFGSAQKLLDGLVEQDVIMLEDEQQAYLKQPEPARELNRALVSVQRLIRTQSRG
ncbi:MULTISPECIES: aromatic ring-hydroxylating dioxygenase subunit alpha [unclassified Leptolyngbya]|uniref:aromatic ring-hydroxylating dioxygenase subunit alpha n=1 Tax=unclassified Leptolyngbya TaxID=2650499 RepID=UPI001683AE52|nr:MULTISPECIES: aromatic ring-hydroxylating dioxygenase subunit alpha [unclassified Leptolyngbya]MBD1910516.1 aromatic ring-hydroxylating dioxygenase subunit alpha [Leptolyngbya sp. FACHB-8]MBD2153887.1 aromatic ring-hydroxylating dioxygenase subunit alpha [Leptolyngbya sp. FACHB-16]